MITFIFLLINSVKKVERSVIVWWMLLVLFSFSFIKDENETKTTKLHFYVPILMNIQIDYNAAKKKFTYGMEMKSFRAGSVCVTTIKILIFTWFAVDTIDAK